MSTTLSATSFARPLPRFIKPPTQYLSITLPPSTSLLFLLLNTWCSLAGCFPFGLTANAVCVIRGQRCASAARNIHRDSVSRVRFVSLWDSVHFTYANSMLADMAICYASQATILPHASKATIASELRVAGAVRRSTPLSTVVSSIAWSALCLSCGTVLRPISRTIHSG